MKPLIGLTPQYDYERSRVFVVENYMKSVIMAGGIPVVLPLHVSGNDLKDLASSLDGFLFTGGPDISPFIYKEETIQACGVVVPERDEMELSLFSIAYKSQKPILGICRGIQVINVCLGGSLYQDLSQFTPSYSMESDNLFTPLPLSHYQKSENHVLSHSVVAEEGSLLHRITSSNEFLVNSFHHQGVKEVAPSLKVSGRSKDSLIEAIEHPNYKFLLGVQWHPEHLTAFDANAYQLFSTFIESCTL